ncbi:MAG: hypothetical protein J0651_02480, partial [Actinobacteria bacterium]|nr:hypothetical protein [Actinomycetota bacterium]
CHLLFFLARRRPCPSCLSSQWLLEFACLQQNQEKQEQELLAGSHQMTSTTRRTRHKNFNYRPSLLFIFQECCSSSSGVLAC